MNIRSPKIDERDQQAVLRDLQHAVPGYTPEWSFRDEAATAALMRIFARYAELFINGLNQVQDRSLLAFLDMLGTFLLPAQAARAPLVFTLMEQSPVNVELPANSQVAAQAQPQPPSPLATGTGTPGESRDIIFATMQTITLTRAQLKEVYSIQPESDGYIDYTAHATGGFMIFDEPQSIPHRLYLGHDALFALAGDAEVELSFDMAESNPKSTTRDLLLEWEYLSEDGWLPLVVVEDTTARFTQDGRIRLKKDCGPDAKQDTIPELEIQQENITRHESYWIRGCVSDKPPSGTITDVTGVEITLKSAVQFVPGDTVTIDGEDRAKIEAIVNQVLTLDAELPDAEEGRRIFLMDRLPPLRQHGSDAAGFLPAVDTIRASVGFTKVGLQPEAAFTDTAPVDLTNNFYPFGQQPRRYTTFYLASGEVFQRRSARVSLQVSLAEPGLIPEGAELRLDWEYSNGTDWQRLDDSRFRFQDDTNRFTYSLLSIDLQGINNLDQKDPTGLEQAFQANGVSLSSRATVAVETAGSLWRIQDRDNRRTYIIRKEDDRLKVYGPTEPLSISFLAPLDWRETTVNGEQNYWLRVRISAGDYGYPLQLKSIPSGTVPEDFTVKAEPSTLNPPVIARLTLQYTYRTEPTLLDHCLTENNFVYEDHSEDCRWQRRMFEPFQPVADRQPAVYFSFDRRLAERNQPSGLISLYLHVPPEAREEETDVGSSAFVWEYHSERGWTELSVLDETLGFRQSGMIQFISPKDATLTPGLGGEQYRIRARLKQGERMRRARVAGVWLNAVWATQRTVVEREVLGISDGNPGQTFSFLRRQGQSTGEYETGDRDARQAASRRQSQPVLEGETVEVREWTGRGDDWETALQGVPEADRRFESDPVTREVVAAWVRWHEKPHLYRSGPTDRHYVIERTTGLMRFGDGSHGFIPPAGSQIIASYSSGGGLAGNVAPHQISELRTGVPYLEKAENPVAATGGTASELLESARARGPQRIRHRDRAVTVTDFEWLAREASPGVARARCLSITGPVGRGQRGWVTVVIIPHSREAQPQPTAELKRRVQKHLSERVPATLASRIRVESPQYVPISVVAEIIPKQPDKATEVEMQIRERLNRFLHPLTGGKANQGWSFGEPVYLSQIARIIEKISDVDYARHIGLRVDGQIFKEHVPVAPHALIAPGDYELKLTISE